MKARRLHRRRAQQDRIVAMIGCRHLHDRRRPRFRCVVAGEFAERSFRQRGLAHRQEMTFEHDLRMRRDRQAGQRSGIDLDRRIFDRAGELVFRLPGGQIFKAGDEQRRILAIDDRERTRLALIPVFFRDEGAVPAAMVELHGQLVPAVHLDAVDRSVDPAPVRIAHDHDRTRTDIGTAVMPVPDRGGKPGEIDVLARVPEKRRVLHDGGLMRTQRLALLHPGLERIERPQCRIDAERKRRALRCGGGVGEDAHAARKTLDGVEQERRPVRSPGRDLGDPADFEARVGAFDPPQRTGLVDKPDEFAQVLVHTHSPPEPLAPRHVRPTPAPPLAAGAEAVRKPRVDFKRLAGYQAARLVVRRGSSLLFATPLRKKDTRHGQASPHRAHRA